MADDFDSLFEPTEEDLNRVGLSKKPWHKNAADFPYDASLNIDDLEGLDRLKCVPDRELAQVMYEQFIKLEPWWGTEDAERDRERRKRKAEDKEVARIVPWAQKAFKGEISIDAKLMAQRVLFPDGYVPLNRTMLPALREFARCLSELRRNGKA
jgi:hypothetical protein